MTEKIRNFWTWFTAPQKEYKQFQEYQKYIADRVAGYESALREAHTRTIDKPVRDGHSPAWKAGHRDGQERQVTPQKEREVRRVSGQEYEKERHRVPDGREAAAAYVRDRFLPDKTETLRAHDVNASGREERTR